MISFGRPGVFSRRFMASVLTIVLSATAASAYTIVMRDGRRLEIPDEFTVTASTLTYKLNSGIQVTLMVAAIDVAATESVNGEQSGAFFRRSRVAGPVASNNAIPARQRSAQRSITNQDLEPYKRVRVESERAYEQRRRQLGLPSAEEGRLEIAESTDRLQQFAREKRNEEQDSEEYWRGRASALRSEIIANDAQIQSVRRRIDQLQSMNTYAGVDPFYPFGGVTQGGVWGSRSSQSTTILTSPNGRARVVNRGYRYPQRPIIQLGNRGRRGYGYNRVYDGIFGYPTTGYDYTARGFELSDQLEELETQRGLLQMRWRELEDEARRAGAYPGWLRRP